MKSAKRPSNNANHGRDADMGRPRRRAALLMNLGTPDDASNRAVRRYLREFLADPFVIKLPVFMRWFNPVLSTIIATFRGGQSAKAYREIWWDEGSPLKVITERQAEKLRGQLGGDWSVYYAMRYANPSVRDVLRRMVDDGITEVVVVPMYPQHAGPTTATALDVLYREMRRYGLRLAMVIRNEWFDDRGYIDAQAQLLHRYAGERGLDPSNSYLLFSTHSMPVSYIKRGDPYEWQVRRSMDLVLKRLGWPVERSALSFQSKLGPIPWLSPSTEDELSRLAEEREKNVIVCPISFTADCLETLEEIGMGYAEDFEEECEGGKLHLAPSLNDDDDFIAALALLVRRGPRSIENDEEIEPLRKIIDTSPISNVVSRLVSVGFRVPSETETGPGEGLIDDEQLRGISRERGDVIAMLRDIVGRTPGVDGCMALNTCQRNEIHLILTDRDEDAMDEAKSALVGALTGDRADTGLPHPFVRSGAEAFGDLVATCLGLSSHLPAELDVMDQFASALRMAEHAGTGCSGLDRIQQAVEHAVVDIREETGWGRFASNFPSAAMSKVEGLSEEMGHLVVIGGSTTSRQVLKAMAGRPRGPLTFVYRGVGRKDLVRFVQETVPAADRICVQRYSDERVVDAIAEADTVVLGVDNREPILAASTVRGLRDFGVRALTLVDFNSHGSIDGEVEIEGLRHVTVHELKEAASAYGRDFSETEAFQLARERATAMIVEYVRRCSRRSVAENAPAADVDRPDRVPVVEPSAVSEPAIR